MASAQPFAAESTPLSTCGSVTGVWRRGVRREDGIIVREIDEEGVALSSPEAEACRLQCAHSLFMQVLHGENAIEPAASELCIGCGDCISALTAAVNGVAAAESSAAGFS